MWDAIDEDNGLRNKMARIIASKRSGIHPDALRADQADYDLADRFAELIVKEDE